MLNKLESIQNLSGWDYNIAGVLVYDPEMPKALLWPRVGLRTSKPGLISGPFIQDLTPEEALPEALKLHKQGYKVLITEWIPPTYSLYSGHCVVFEEENGFIEYFEGPGVVRDVDRHPDRILVRFASALQGPVIFEQVIKDSRDIRLLSGFDSVIVEFSIVDRPSGVKEDTHIYWEYRAYE